MTTYEEWKGYKPNVNHLRIFRCSAYAHIPKDARSKMDPKARRASSLDMALVLKGIDSLIQTHRKSSIAEMSYLMKQHP